MCGIAGFIGINNKSLLERMLQIQKHRGPDKTGLFFQNGNGIGIGNVRLSIIDITDRGDQPLYNESKDVVVVFNGEIYNYKELRENLIKKGHKFYSNTDTEVIIHLYEEHSEKFVDYLNGMFGIAVLDLKNKRLILVRDRLGIKPLYYTLVDKRLIFASELKAILLYKEFSLNYKAIDNYLTYRYITDGQITMFSNIYKLLPGEILIYNYRNSNLKKYFYWDIKAKTKNRYTFSDDKEKFEYFFLLMKDSVKKRMIADVPVGIFLSSGIDSSLVAYFMAEISGKPIKTFSIDFGTEIDETKDVIWYTKMIGSDHHQLRVETQDISLLNKIIWYFDEPLGDAIIIPMYLLSKYARKKVKVVLTGEGADEVFSGYIHHFVMHYGDKLYKAISEYGVKILYNFVKLLSPKFLNLFFPYPAFIGESGKNKLLNYLKNPLNYSISYFRLTTLFSPQEKEKLYTNEFKNELSGSYLFDSNVNSIRGIEDVPIYDLKHWLPDNILFKQDRTSMAASLESRVPYLDHRIVEFLVSLDLSEKIKYLKSKYFLRKIAKKVLPSQITNRPKKAFYIPIDKIFGNRFYQLLNDALENLKKRKILNADYIKMLLKNYTLKSGEILYTKQLMAIFILELWFQNYIDKRNEWV